MKVLIDLSTAVHAMEALHLRENWYDRRGYKIPEPLRAASKELTRVVSDALGTSTQEES